jgi:transcriptional regulator with XRE-family HTH domain
MARLRLTVERERRGFSKAQLARRASIDQGLVGKIESGRIQPYPKELGRLARALGVSKENAQTLLDDASDTGR